MTFKGIHKKTLQQAFSKLEKATTSTSIVRPKVINGVLPGDLVTTTKRFQCLEDQQHIKEVNNIQQFGKYATEDP